MYAAQVHASDAEGFWLTPNCPSIKHLEAYLTKAFADDSKRPLRNFAGTRICDPDVIHQIVVLKARKYKLPQIHGYYDWVDGKLKLDRNKPVGVHNAIFFGETDD